MTETSPSAKLQHAGLQASSVIFEELYDDLVAFLRPLDEAALNWTPPPTATNSIAALVRHIVGSNEAWLARAAGESFRRDRDAEFRARAAGPALIDALEASRGEARRRFVLLDSMDLATIRMVQRLQNPDPEPVTAAWCVVHALRHSGEHWGQIQLTLQLYKYHFPE
jgi:uncharacterized damage-inducible protein DinB